MKSATHPDKLIKCVSAYMLSVGLACAVLAVYAPTTGGTVFFGTFGFVGITCGLSGWLY